MGAGGGRFGNSRRDGSCVAATRGCVASPGRVPTRCVPLVMIVGVAIGSHTAGEEGRLAPRNLRCAGPRRPLAVVLSISLLCLTGGAAAVAAPPPLLPVQLSQTVRVPETTAAPTDQETEAPSVDPSELPASTPEPEPTETVPSPDKPQTHPPRESDAAPSGTSGATPSAVPRPRRSDGADSGHSNASPGTSEREGDEIPRPVEARTGFPLDTATGYAVHPRTGLLIVPSTGIMVAPGSLEPSGFAYDFDARLVVLAANAVEPTSMTPRPSEAPTSASAEPGASPSASTTAPSSATPSDKTPFSSAETPRAALKAASNSETSQPLTNVMVGVVTVLAGAWYFFAVFRKRKPAAPRGK